MKKTKRILSLILVIMMLLSSVSVAFGAVTIIEIPLRVKEWAQSPGTKITIFTNSMGTFEVVDIDTSIIENDMLSFDPSTGIVSTEYAGGDTLRSYVTYNNGVSWVTANTGEYSSIILDDNTFDIVYSDNIVLNDIGASIIYNSSTDNDVPFQVAADLTEYNAIVNGVTEADYTAESWATYESYLNSHKVTRYNTQAEVDSAELDIANAQANLVLKPTEADLTGYIITLSAVNEENYTPYSWGNYKSVVDANVVTASSTQKEVDTAIDNIVAAQIFLEHIAEFTFYDELISSVDSWNYTTTSWTTYQEVVDSFVLTLDSSQSEVDEAVAAITFAKSNLVFKANLASYDIALGNVTESNYTPQSWAIYMEVVNANPASTEYSQEVVDTAELNILIAQANLVIKPDFTEYDTVIASVNESDYTVESWKAYQARLTELNVTVNLSQYELDGIVDEILMAQSSLLILKQVGSDLTQYNVILNKVLVESDYTTESWLEYQNIRATNVVNSSNTQKEVDTATENISYAQQTLVFAGRAALNEALNVVNELNHTDYSDDSWQALLNTIMTPAYTQAEIVQQTIDIYDKIGELIKLPVDLTEYNVLVESVNAKDFTTTSWGIYLMQMNSIELIMTTDNLKSEVANAIQLITMYQGNLVLADVVDKTELNALIDTVANYVQADYTVGSWNELQNTLELPENTAEEVLIKVTFVQAAADGLVFDSQEDLEYAKNVFSKLIQTDYTPDSWALLVEITQFDESTNDNVDFKFIQTMNLIRGLEKILGDLTELNELFKDMYKADYTTESWETFFDIYTSANVTAEGSLQSEIDSLVVRLTEAKKSLVAIRGNVTRYIEAIESVNEEAYTTESWSAYIATINLNMNMSNLQSQIDLCTQDIKNAQLNLVLKEYASLTELHEILNSVEELDYTSESWIEYINILSTYDVNETMKQAEVDAICLNIKVAQQSLVARPAYLGDYEFIVNYFKSEDCTEETWNEFKKVLDANVVTSENLQSEVNKATQAINEATVKLLLKSTIERFNKLMDIDNLGYSDSDWEDYTELRSRLISEGVYTNEEYSGAVRELENALSRLGMVFTLEWYDKLIEIGEQYKYKFSEDNWNSYQEILSQNILTENNTSDEIQNGVNTIGISLTRLVPIDGTQNILTYFLLNSIVDEEDYTESSWKEYQVYVIELPVTWETDEKELQGIIRHLLYEQHFLKLKADLTEYNSLLTSIKQSDYVGQSWAIYAEILKNNILTDESTKEQINLAINNIKVAQANLVKKPTDTGSSGGGGGGSIEPPAPIVIVVPPVIPPVDSTRLEFVVGNEKVVVPVRETIAFKEGIRGYVQGYDDNTFKPDNKVTRAETTQMISNILETSGMLKPEITDVNVNAWYAEAVGGVMGAGIMNGYGDSTFKPERNITRQEFAVTLVNMLDLSSMTTKTNKEFPDIENIYGKEAIEMLASLGVLSGYPDGTFKPNNEITRAEMVVILNRLLGNKLQTEQRTETEEGRIQREQFEEFKKSIEEREKEAQKALEMALMSKEELARKVMEQELNRLKAEYEAELNRVMRENSERLEREIEERLKRAGITDIQDSWARDEIMQALGK